MSIVVSLSWWLATHSYFHLLDLGMVLRVVSIVDLQLVPWLGGSVIVNAIGRWLRCILGVLLGVMLVSSASVSPLVVVLESLLTYVVVLELLLVLCLGYFVISFGVFQIVSLMGVFPSTVNFFISVWSACSMSHSESMTYFR